MKTKKSRCLRDRLSRLEYKQACKLLGENGKELINRGAQYDNIDLKRDVYMRGNVFRLVLRQAEEGRDVRVTLTFLSPNSTRLAWSCDACESACEHLGAALSLILDDKYSLGLSEIPEEGVPFERLNEDTLVERALAERAKRARDEPFRMQSLQPKTPWADYIVTSGHSGKTYRVALRGENRGDSFCSCPDFCSNTLGTCKHVLYVLGQVKKRFSRSARSRPKRPRDFIVHLNYSDEVTLRMRPPFNVTDEETRVVKGFLERPVNDVPGLLRRVAKLQRAGRDVIIYPDAEQWIQQRLFQARIGDLVEQIRQDPKSHSLRKELLKTELLPYQMDGIAFAAGTGRAILADDMGLGKTIQGIGVAELLARVADVRRVLVVCPASLKSQWRSEVERFSGRDCQLVLGNAEERSQQYDNDSFFTACNYEQVLRDFPSIERVNWDLIILDEGQRIKNWESKTSNVIKALKSPFALVLSGTPLENRLDDLYSVVQFIDDRRLAPAFRFFHRHRVVDDKGKVVGYKNLAELRENLKPILLRRTREDVLDELPDRNTQVIKIPACDQQRAISDNNVRTAAQIAAKKFLTEMDLLRIQKALLMARMAADSTFLVDKEEPGFSSKLEYLESFLPSLMEESGRKAIVFSEWTTMLDLVEPILRESQLDFVRLDGSIPQKKRQRLVERFQEDPECKLFLMTNAGSTGLNLQAANTVINVDLPWNPAVLEQRIARAHRMGQKNPVDVYLLVSEGTLEERLLDTLAQKHELAVAALDASSEVDFVDFQSGVTAMRSRLEVLLGEQPATAGPQAAGASVVSDTPHEERRRERVAQAGGELLGAALQFLGQLVDQEMTEGPSEEVVTTIRENLRKCVDEREDGRQELRFTLPDRSAVDELAQTLARLLVPKS